jgi:branched-chain amino acid aminotransferase
MIGLSGADKFLDQESFLKDIRSLIEANQPSTDQFFRVTIHATELVPGVKTADLQLTLSVFMYEAETILPPKGARLKTSLWRRTADTAIPARAKVNGAYVNSALAKQDAIDAGFDDCLFLNGNGYVSELSAANIFMVKRGQLITPDCSSDILEGITRRSIIELATAADIKVTERKIALTELYTADEIFACGTSAFISPIIEIDGRQIGNGHKNEITVSLKSELQKAQAERRGAWTTVL